MRARRSIPLVLVWVCALAGALVWSAPALAQRKHEFGFAFGSEGSGEGQFKMPGQLAVNEATGDVYVIDRGSSRVEIFDAAGAYIGQFDGSEAPTGKFTFYTFPSERRTTESPDLSDGTIAVDNSTNPLDPSKGDVYVAYAVEQNHAIAYGVVDKFTAGGRYIGQVTGISPSSRLGAEVSGVAVDLNGGLWVEEVGAARSVYHFNDAAPVNEFVSEVEPQVPPKPGNPGRSTLAFIGLALDSEGNLYTGVKTYLLLNGPVFPAEFSAVTGQPLFDPVNEEEETTGVAVDESSNDAYYDHETSVVAESPAHHAIERFGSAQLQDSEGIAVDSATGTVYASDAVTQSVDVFPAFVVPDASTGEASGLGETQATVAGVVDPDGLPVASCVFEYGTGEGYGQSEPCTQTPAQIGSGSSPVAVSAHLTGLNPLTKYHFRLSVANANGSNQGLDRTFITPRPVVLSEQAVSDVSSTGALFSVQINPGGAETAYSFEYGTSEAYGQSVPVPAAVQGPGIVSVPVSARVEGLEGGVTYHVRVVASNALGVVYGPDEVFTTQAAGGAFVLPDGRQWELVSPPNKNGAQIAPIGGIRASDIGLIEGSAQGDGISYVASGPVGSGVRGNADPFGFTQVLSRRGSGGGWSSEDITTPQTTADAQTAQYTFFSSELSRAVVAAFPGMPPFSPEASEETPYVHDTETGGYVPVVSPGDVPPGTRFAEGGEFPKVLAVTPDLSHVLVRSTDALTGNALNSKPGTSNLYEWSEGRLQLVNTEIPGRTQSEDGAELGSENSEDLRNVVSSDGSRVFFTVGGSVGALYMRDTVTGETVQVDAPVPGDANFQIASTDGSEVFFLDEQPLTADSKLKPVPIGTESGLSDLYVYDVGSGVLTDLSVDQNAGEAAAVQSRVVGVGGDGSIVYFVAKGRLAEGAQAGQDNLYVESETGASWSAPRLVAVLSQEDSPVWGIDVGGGEPQSRYMSSRVSPDGRYLVFMSDRSLTGYDNRDASSGAPDEEVYVYDELAGSLRCVSCNPTGARPDGVLDPPGSSSETLLNDRSGIWQGRWLAASIPGWTGRSGAPAYPSRVVSDAGRVFFDAVDALVPQATNGKMDVYEYEPQGVGGCVRAGCVGLISAGTSAEESSFLDASESGDDVFFLTSARLTGEDLDAAFDVYDAHVCSAVSPCGAVRVVPPACASGDACKAAPSPQPAIFGAPGSATFAGAGNVVSGAVSGGGPVPKPAAKKKRRAHGRRRVKRGRGARGGKRRRARGGSSTGIGR